MDASHAVYIRGDHSSPADQTSLHSDGVRENGDMEAYNTTCQIPLLHSVCIDSYKHLSRRRDSCKGKRGMQDVYLCEMTKGFCQMKIETIS